MKHEQVDEQIIASVRGGNSRFGDIWASVRIEHIYPYRINKPRLVDRRLQALRKKGVVEHVKGGVGWRLTSSQGAVDEKESVAPK